MRKDNRIKVVGTLSNLWYILKIALLTLLCFGHSGLLRLAFVLKFANFEKVTYDKLLYLLI